jgi:two-component system chemotaxis response regulator CheY
MRALIVDDSPVMRKVIERALRQAGVELTEVIQAGSGGEALALLRKSREPIHLIVSDISMPGMDGLQFLELQRSENLAPGVPAFVIATESSTELVLRAIAAGARGYICKPFTPEQIRAQIVPALLLSLA